LSVLTKLFVVLLVVSSLLLSASVVVFVNRVEDNKATADAATKKLASARREVEELNKAVASSRRDLLDAQNEMAKQLGEKERDIVARETTIQEKNAKIAQADKDSQIKDATIKGNTDALKAAQEENKGLQTANLEIRNKYDDVLKQSGELNTRVTELDNKLRTTEKALEYNLELVAQKNAELAGMRQKGSVAGGSSEATPDAGPINGVIRRVDIIGGKKYATISVGSSDNVTKGMKFSVIDSGAGKFLGYVTVDSVQPNEAVGQVEGPAVDKIQANLEVKTKL
jgi:hypothetical protein